MWPGDGPRGTAVKVQLKQIFEQLMCYKAISGCLADQLCCCVDQESIKMTEIKNVYETKAVTLSCIKINIKPPPKEFREMTFSDVKRNRQLEKL
uniref:Uncharacterized protein n=1 Tax=Romanomermis culicivorax TaxID=13658 RepID=A0A915L9T2_ROMCU